MQHHRDNGNGEPRIAGFVIARINIESNATSGYILAIEVTPAYRHRGVAQKMVREIEAALRERGIRECCLEVRENNIAALNLCKKLGYKK